MPVFVPRGYSRIALAAAGSILCLPLTALAQAPSAGAARVSASARPSPDNPAVAIVGSQSITSSDYQAALEKQAGKAVLTKLVYASLVRQAAQKAGILPADADVDARIADLSRRNPQTAALAQDPATRRDFREDLRSDIALENLRIEHVTASDAEINAFYAAHQSAFTLPSQVQTTMVVAQTKTDAAHAQTLLRRNMSPDEIALQPRLHVAGVNGFNVNMASLPPAVTSSIGKAVLAMSPGQTQIVPAGAYFLVFKVKSAQNADTPPLAQIREQVARQVKLGKAISSLQELALLYAANPPQLSSPKYEAYFNALPRAVGPR